MEDNGKENKERWLDESQFDVIVLGTGLTESLVAGALARVGKKVLHLDKNEFYGNLSSCFNLQQFEGLLKGAKSASEEKKSSKDAEENKGRIRVSNDEVVEVYNCESFTTSFTLDSLKKSSKETSKDAKSEEEQTKESTTTESKEEEEKEVTTESKEAESTKEETPQTTEQQQVTESTAAESKKEEEGVSTTETKEAVKEEEPSNLEKLLKQSRYYSIDISPKVMYSCGPEVKLLISSGVARYLEFKVIENTYLFSENMLQLVACTKGDLFKSKFISLIEKRILSKFLGEFMKESGDETAAEATQTQNISGMTFTEYLNSHKLTPKLQDFVLYAIAFLNKDQKTKGEEISAEEGLKLIQKYIESMGKYGNTAFIVSLYGNSEFPQAFCRLCAVYGGLYVLRRSAREVVVEDGIYKHIIDTEGQPLNSTYFVAAASYFPQFASTKQMVSRCVCVTGESLVEGEKQIFAVIPPGTFSKYSIIVIQYSSELCVCPKDTYLVHFVTIGEAGAKQDLEKAVRSLLRFPDSDHNDKPPVLYCAYFNRNITVPNAAALPKNMYIATDPGVELDCANSVEEAKRIFSSICPDEEFLPKVPNPEDIVWEDDTSSSTAQDTSSSTAQDTSASSTAQETSSESAAKDTTSSSTPQDTTETPSNTETATNTENN